MGGRRLRRRKGSKVAHTPGPSEEGRELMDSGTFGSSEYYRDILRKRKQRLARRLMSRELGLDAVQDRKAKHLMSQVYIKPQSQ